MNSSQFLTLLLFAFLICGCVNSDAECFSEHRSLLLKLKHGISVSPEELASWKPNSDCCDWEGITCEPRSGHVIGLDLGGRNIPAGIDFDIVFSLTSLQTLNLSNTGFYEITVPQTGFEKLQELRQLDLSDAGLLGQIPIGISRLARLEYLVLSVCQPVGDEMFFVGLLELRNPNFSTMIRNLSNLRVLRLRCVNLHQDVEWLTALSTSVPHLQILDLCQTNLTGSLSEELFQLKVLEYLDLSDNYHMSGHLPEFSKDCALQHMFLRDMYLLGTIPESFWNLKNLTEVSLSGNELTGTISASIGNFTRLVHLDLSDNKLTGVIPTSVGSLTQLVFLDLSRNYIIHAIPTSIGTLEKLTRLDLSTNGLTGSVPGSLFFLPLLQRLDLSYNQLSGELDVSLNASTLLMKIRLNGNQLYGQIPPSLFYLPSLEHLDLGSNNFSGAVELDRIAVLNNLTYLDLSNNMLSCGEFDGNNFLSLPNLRYLGLISCGLTKVPTFLNNLTNMEFLDLSNNKIGPDIPRWMWSNIREDLNLSHNLFTNIEGSEDMPMSMLQFNLDLSSNMLHGRIPISPPFTELVDFSNNSFSSAIPPEFFFNLSVQAFSVAHNNLSGEIPLSICNATAVGILDLSNNLFSGSIPSCLLESGRLVDINLGRNRLQGTVPRNITWRCILRSLILCDNHLEASLPRSLVNCSELAVLDLANNHIADTFPFWLGDILPLRVLSLRANEFYGPLRPSESQEANCTFPRLQVFDLSSNYFNGKLSPICFSGLRQMMNPLNLTSSIQYAPGYSPPFLYETNIAVIKGHDVLLLHILYTVVDFSNNSFEGDIPPLIGGLGGLNVLNLSHNSITGNIPFELGSLTNLQTLDLSTNHLSGKIPQCLTSLTFLELLDLSKNNLSGRIPQDHQFSTFSNASFQENPGLCGIPLSKQCGKNAMPSVVIPDHSSSLSSYVIVLALFIGIGFGVGIAVVLVLQNVPLKFLRVNR